MTKKSYTRREFLKVSGVVVAAGSVTCCGLGALASRSPKVETPEINYGKESIMSNRILVTYATKAGSTAEIAAKIGEHLSERGFAVDVMNVKSKADPKNYQAVILGSCIRMGGWLPEMMDYINANQFTLNAMQAALFTVHMLNAGEDETSKAARTAYMDKVRALMPGSEEVYFLGAMDYSKLSLLDRFISKMVKSVESDQRDWDKIKNWSETLVI
ncbi:MAG: flavodoxin domain-containing protein [Anaerolineaceae bacterium]|nr:flavodoxin domain-containing protein [Anaerolineaceae bacterium]